MSTPRSRSERCRSTSLLGASMRSRSPDTKLYAPKGIGALFVKRGHAFGSVMAGAGQEAGRRPGTENVPGIVGLGAACAIAARRLTADAARLADLRERLWQRLAAAVPGIVRVAAGAPTLPNTLNVLFPRTIGNDLLAVTPGIAASTGSACHAGDSRPSAILLALGYPPDAALGAVRLTLGRATDATQVDRAADLLASSFARCARSGA